ncbi:probable serine/threonine-protein kinase fhkE [Musca domestica]|uniref:Probable serine/threonine-protein kinase fhkE n=1 Tax=Musca domestica TaxID=7370 RepID=A0A9J7DJH6_MUSDO|nr:probable serine/threonine-protein kinase fhkE [Musca domestica]
MSRTDEQSLRELSLNNKSKLALRLANRVSFGETANRSVADDENEYEVLPSTSAALARIASSPSVSYTNSLPSSSSSSTKPLKRNTPILFSTNRGLHLRMPSSSTSNSSASGSNYNNNNNLTSTTKSSGERGSGVVGGSSRLSKSRTNNNTSNTVINPSYTITFCDLERWSTNRANAVSLEDTFTIARPAVVPNSATTGSLASSSLRFVPQKTTTNSSIRFKGYSRFDVE